MEDSASDQKSFKGTNLNNGCISLESNGTPPKIKLIDTESRFLVARGRSWAWGQGGGKGRGHRRNQ